MKAWLALFLFASAPLPAWAAPMMENVRAHYAAGEFDAFFGAAVWSRLNSGTGLSAEERDRLLALELMGLARHCQWEAISALKEEVAGPLALKAFELIEVKAEYKSFISDPRRRSLSPVKKVTSAREHWGLESGQMKSFASPEHLRVKVRSLCASS